MLSAHADGDELMRWLSVFKRAPRRVFIVHGEPEASKALRVRIERELAGYRATAGSGVPPMSTGIRVRLPRP
jgi:metallo-beta-lactamase family protein